MAALLLAMDLLPGLLWYQPGVQKVAHRARWAAYLGWLAAALYLIGADLPSHTLRPYLGLLQRASLPSSLSGCLAWPVG